MRRLLILQPRKKRIMFRLEPEVFAKVQAWLGPLTIEDLKVSLKCRIRWMLSIGAIFVFLSLPIDNQPFAPMSFGLGLALFLTGAIAKIRPHRFVFAVESLWFCLLAGNSIFAIVAWNAFGPWRLFVLCVELSLAVQAILDFRRFADLKTAADDESWLEAV